ncbi:MAG: glycoside hydrolase family 3 N-terminal domain-containing protein [Eubacteriales bacterium]|nr:glycoside hydrolase family 3 N-terminal domain-containing protein [Eubacteriales bacterium]
MKKRYLLLIPVVACIIISAASIGYIQLHPDRAPDGARFLTQLSGSKQAEPGSAADSQEEESLNTAQRHARELAASMTLEQKIYQIMFVSPEVLTDSGDTVVRAGDATKQSIVHAPVGGVLYSSQNVQTQEQITEMLNNTQEYAKASGAKIPMFLGIEDSNSSVSQLLGMDDLSFDGEASRAKEVGNSRASRLTSVGFNVEFAPSADISDTEDPADVSETVRSAISAMQQGSVLSAISHFPGEGSADADPAAGAASTDRSLQEFEDTDFTSFQAGIEADVSFVVVSNMTASAFDDVPCSLSEAVVTKLLRNELGYDGIILTGKLTDAAITGSYATSESVVQAIQAGADMLLCPSNVQDAYLAISSAVADGTITEDRITESVQRILTAKIAYGIMT